MLVDFDWGSGVIVTDADASSIYTRMYAKIAEHMTDSKYNCEESSVGDLTEVIPGSFNEASVSMDKSSVDHIFYKGNIVIKHYSLLSYSYLYDISDHYAIFVDAQLN